MQGERLSLGKVAGGIALLLFFCLFAFALTHDDVVSHKEARAAEYYKKYDCQTLANNLPDAQVDVDVCIEYLGVNQNATGQEVLDNQAEVLDAQKKALYKEREMLLTEPISSLGSEESCFSLGLGRGSC